MLQAFSGSRMHNSCTLAVSVLVYMYAEVCDVQLEHGHRYKLHHQSTLVLVVVEENGQLRKARPHLTLALTVAQVHGLQRTARLILTCVSTAMKVLGHLLLALIQPFV